MAPEQIMALVGSVTALVICLGALRGAKRWEKSERGIKPPPRERRPTGFGGPWGD